MSVERIKELTDILNEARKTYYMEDTEIMNNFEYDKLYDELEELEKKTGIVYSNSPTQNVGYEVVSELPKETHESPMLSLDKTKSIEELAEFIGAQKGILSWKLDGLTVVLTYNDGKLAKAVTRGNGEVGEVITSNARFFQNLPADIKFKGELIIRGEAIIKYSDFEKINADIKDAESKYKNPRNLCSGSVRQLDSSVTAKRNVNFFAFSLVKAEGIEFKNSREYQIRWLSEQGFSVVEYKNVVNDIENNKAKTYGAEMLTIEEAVKYFSDNIKENDSPSDGLVLIFDDIEYGRSLGTTAKFPRDSIAFKWADETAITKLLEIEWSPSRTGLINPIAIFEAVELEGTTVSRASLHNISIMENFALGVGDEIEVYKANMIIPQILKNYTMSGVKDIPDVCPACGQIAVIKDVNGIKNLNCINDKCPAKHIKSFTHFVSRNAMNIDGLSEETLEKFVDAGYIKEFADIYRISRFEEKIINMEGFKEKSYNNLVNAVEASKDVALANFINSLGIANIGLSNAKLLAKYFDYDFDKIRNADKEELAAIDGIGPIIAETVFDYFKNDENNRIVDELLQFLKIKQETTSTDELILDGKVFVITGSLETFENRDTAKEMIEKLGGKVTGSVTGKTDYLINNNVTSNSGKNKKAKELGVPIISETDFLEMVGM